MIPAIVGTMQTANADNEQAEFFGNRLNERKQKNDVRSGDCITGLTFSAIVGGHFDLIGLTCAPSVPSARLQMLPRLTLNKARRNLPPPYSNCRFRSASRKIKECAPKQSSHKNYYLLFRIGVSESPFTCSSFCEQGIVCVMQLLRAGHRLCMWGFKFARRVQPSFMCTSLFYILSEVIHLLSFRLF